MSARFIRLAAIALALSPAGCGLNLIGSGDGVSVGPAGKDLVLRNRTSRTVYYFAVDARTWELIDWAACSDPAVCVGVAPGGRKRIMPSEIVALTPETREVRIELWHLVPAQGGRYELRWLEPVTVRL